MDVIVALLFTAAAVLAALAAFGVGRRVALGWLALAFLAAGFAVPALDAAVSVT